MFSLNWNPWYMNMGSGTWTRNLSPQTCSCQDWLQSESCKPAYFFLFLQWSFFEKYTKHEFEQIKIIKSNMLYLIIILHWSPLITIKSATGRQPAYTHPPTWTKFQYNRFSSCEKLRRSYDNLRSPPVGNNTKCVYILFIIGGFCNQVSNFSPAGISWWQMHIILNFAHSWWIPNPILMKLAHDHL